MLLGIIYAIFLAAIPATRLLRILIALIGIIGLGYMMAGALALVNDAFFISDLFRLAPDSSAPEKLVPISRPR